MIKIKLWRLNYILSFAFFFFMLPLILVSGQESVYIDGDEEIIPLLTYTKYFTERPLLFFKDQLDLDLLEKVDSIVLCDSTQNDIIFRLMKWLKLKQGANKIFVDEEGVYGLFIEKEEFLKKNMDGFKIILNQFQFFVLNKKLPLDDQYIKIKDLFFKKGENIIVIEQDVNFFLGSQKNYLILKNKLKSKEFCYVFGKDDDIFYTPGN